MRKGLAFYAIATDLELPEDLKLFFNERLSVCNIFGNKCYVILEDEDKSPLNLLDEKDHRRIERWLATVDSDKVFYYRWSA
jgi:hypothetical protein